MKQKKYINSVLLILTALIWGTAFVAQSEGGASAGPFTFNCIRSFIGGAALLPVILFSDKKRGRRPPAVRAEKTLFQGGIACGVILFLASTAQQLGLYFGASVGKAGFLTACYILLVPVLGLFLHKKCGWNIWLGVVLTVIGLYLLCMKGEFSIQLSDALLILCALLFSLHIIVIDYFSPKVDGVRMSCIQFFVCGILSLFLMIAGEMHIFSGGAGEWLEALCSRESMVSILYAGILSCGVGYTLQIIGQNGINPTVASLLMSLESVFSVLAGWVILGQSLTVRELAGCGLIFTAIIIAQIPVVSAAEHRNE